MLQRAEANIPGYATQVWLGLRTVCPRPSNPIAPDEKPSELANTGAEKHLWFADSIARGGLVRPHSTTAPQAPLIRALRRFFSPHGPTCRTPSELPKNQRDGDRGIFPPPRAEHDGGVEHQKQHDAVQSNHVGGAEMVEPSLPGPDDIRCPQGREDVVDIQPAAPVPVDDRRRSFGRVRVSVAVVPMVNPVEGEQDMQHV